MKMFEIRSITVDKYNRPYLLVAMDLEQYNTALDLFIANIQDNSYNEGFRQGNNYPSEEELADMDHDRTSDDS